MHNHPENLHNNVFWLAGWLVGLRFMVLERFFVFWVFFFRFMFWPRTLTTITRFKKKKSNLIIILVVMVSKHVYTNSLILFHSRSGAYFSSPWVYTTLSKWFVRKRIRQKWQSTNRSWEDTVASILVTLLDHLLWHNMACSPLGKEPGLPSTAMWGEQLCFWKRIFSHSQTFTWESRSRQHLDCNLMRGPEPQHN